MNNVVPLRSRKRDLRVLRSDNLRPIALDDDLRDMVNTLNELPAVAPEREWTPPVPEVLGGIADAIGSYLADTRFLVGFNVGVWLAVACAFVVAFVRVS